jgi:hypothetical protein
MTTAYSNRLVTAVPPHDVHERFLSFAQSLLKRMSAAFSISARNSKSHGEP